VSIFHTASFTRRRRRVKDAVWKIDTLSSITELMDLCKADKM